MIKEGKIGVQEAVCLITIAITTRVFFTSPGVLADVLGTTGWYMTLISAAGGALGFTFVYLLLKRFPGKNLVEIFDKVFGRWIGFAVSFLLAVIFMLNAAIMLREFTDVMKVYVLELSPPAFIMGIFVIGVAVAAFMGLEAIARFSKLIAYFLLTAFIAVLVLSWQNYEVHRLTPLLGNGLDKTFYHGALRSTVYADAIILGVIAGPMQGVNHIKKAGYRAILLSGLLISVSFIAFSLTFPYYTAAEITAPMYQMASLIDYGRFIQRLESLFLFVWNISTFISVSISFYISLSVYSKVFRIQNIRPIILPACVILITLALIPKDIVSVVKGYVHVIRQSGWIVFFVPPILALGIAKIRRLKGGAQNA